MPSVVLLSGGLDSSANLALCAERDEPVLALTCAYGQRAQVKEIHAAQKLSRYYGVRHEVIQIPWLGVMGGSSLTDSNQSVPELATDQLDRLDVTQKSAKSVWVPNRNGILINIAAAFAEKEGALRVLVGFNREEAMTFPDNSAEFLKRASSALEYSTANHVEVHSYTTELDKTEIVQALKKLSKPFPFDLVWSCYLGGEAMCGHCESCQRYKRAQAQG
ncbi:MAG: 7-cyano-7-deazaguanine synthase QueC [Methylotenera sp.]|nr:7-cyano-7-deazaguanine synthase QueC [Oligoflexia bacterium]